MSDETEIPDEVENLPDTELEWGEEDAPPKKKRGSFLPTWLWVCGGGCLLAIILSIGGGLFCVGQVAKMMNPDVQWPRLQKVLPFDEQPEHLQMLAGLQLMGTENYTLLDLERGFMATVYYFDSESAEEARQAFFDPEMQAGFMGMGEREREELSMIRIGSRDRQVMRFYQTNVPFSFGNEDFRDANSGPSAAVDLTAAEDPGCLVVVFFDAGGEGEIPDEDMIAFFENFLID